MSKSHLGHVGQPLQQSKDALKVVTNGAVGHAVVVHDLNSAQLVVGRVNFSTQNLMHTTEHKRRFGFMFSQSCFQKVMRQDSDTISVSSFIPRVRL